MLRRGASGRGGSLSDYPVDLRHATDREKFQLLQVFEIQAAGTDAIEELAREDPRDFITEVLGAKPTPAALKHGYKVPWTPDQDRVLLSLQVNRKTCVAAGVGVGKTRIAAWAVLWFLYSRSPSKVITTAPTWLQVEKLLWKEIGAAWRGSLKVLPGKLLNTEIQLSDEHFALGLAAKTDVGDISATRFQGFHSTNVLVVLDEATGVSDEVWDGAEGLALRPTDRILAIGNPTDPGSRFKRVFDLGTWHSLYIDCCNHPNYIHSDPDIIPGATSREWVEEKLEEYGSEQAPLYVAKVKGGWPDQASDALISIGWIHQAQVRWQRIAAAIEDRTHKPDGRGIALGMDVAGEGEDLTAMWEIDNGRLFMPEVFGRPAWHVGRDVMKAVGLVVAFLKANLDQYGFTRVRAVAMDDTGLGQGVSARLGEMQYAKELPMFALNDDRHGRQVEIIPINFGSSPVSDRFGARKDELWWEMREALRAGTLALPPDSEIERYAFPKQGGRRQSLISQLSVPFYASNSAGKILVFDKRGSRGGGSDERTRDRVANLPASSPDLAHAAMLAREAWSGLRVDKAAPRPQSTEDAFVAQMIELAHKRHRNAKKPVKAYKGRNW